MRETRSETVGQAGTALRRLTLLICLAFSFPAAAQDDPREVRAACWEAYNICAVGAENVDAWRTVCYSDYSACMKNPPEVQCRPEDKAKCADAHKECTARGEEAGGQGDQCRQDQQVCLDAFGC